MTSQEESHQLYVNQLRARFGDGGSHAESREAAAQRSRDLAAHALQRLLPGGVDAPHTIH